LRILLFFDSLILTLGFDQEISELVPNMLVCDENLICQILQAFRVQNQLCIYMLTHEPQFFKSVLLTTSISLYAGSDTYEGALELYEDMPWPCYLASVIPLHMSARHQGRRGSGWALPDVVSVSASPRHQTRWRPSPATGHLHSRLHGHWTMTQRRREDDRDPTTKPSSRVPGRAWTPWCPAKKGTPSVHICKSQNDSRVKSWPLEPVHHCSQFRVVFLFLPSVWLFLVAMIFFKMFGD
jgi:hypothetical protein